MITRRLALVLLPALLLAVAGCAASHTGLTAEQIRVLSEQGFHDTDDGWTFGAEDKVAFNSNSSVVQPEMQTKLQEMAHALLGVNIQHLRVEGFTDKFGSDAYNNDLSLHRAQAVADGLISSGIPAAGVIVHGLGSQHPISLGNSAEEQAQNRRVAITVLVP
jgi:outer membrane protein OmpA-like peptidoglycan-associated protein